MTRWLALLCLLPTLAYAADGDDCVSSILVNGQSQYSCMKLCDAKDSGAITCGPIQVKDQDATLNKIMVQVTGGCGYDDILVGELANSTTSGIAVKAYGVIDDDLASVAGTTGTSEIVVPFPIGPYIWVSSGTLAGCSTPTFSIWLLQKHKPQ